MFAPIKFFQVNHVPVDKVRSTSVETSDIIIKLSSIKISKSVCPWQVPSDELSTCKYC